MNAVKRSNPYHKKVGTLISKGLSLKEACKQAERPIYHVGNKAFHTASQAIKEQRSTRGYDKPILVCTS